MPNYKRSRCRLCDSSKVLPAFSLQPTPCANAFVTSKQPNSAEPHYPLDIHFCLDCFHLQLFDVVDPDELFSDYVYVTGTSPVFRKHFDDYAALMVQRFAVDADDLVVDLGSNDGTLLHSFQRLKCRTLGVDPAENIAKQANQAGIETITGFFDSHLAQQIKSRSGSAKLVTANNVFAHVDDLRGFANAVRLLLHPQGVFVFEASYLLDVIEKNLFDTMYHEHLDYHSVLPLVSFFESVSMTVFDVERVNTHGGSIRVYVKHQQNLHLDVKPAVQNMIALEKDAGLTRLATFQNFSKSIKQQGQVLRSLLCNLREKKQRIAGFGAPAKATTLMHEFALDASLISFIVDDSPLKQGLFTPGLHIPVLPVSALYEEKVDYAIILAWNFAEPIIKNHQAFIDKGGKFIVPLPTLEVIG